MSQLNIHVNAAFERALQGFMRARGIRTKSEAIRVAVREGLARAEAEQKDIDFKQWLGLGNQAPHNPNPRYSSNEAMWE
ncbi:MAG: hypothetical protein HQL52_16115 [Magnetococcales bacterium]|nr:hypothetical protein [Magnetococcales bacterium]